MRLILVTTFSFIIFSTQSLLANDDAGVVFYREKVYPILKEHCFSCHGGKDKLKGEFRVTSREGLLRGGEFGPGYDEVEPAKSLFLEMISYKDADYEMPPKAKLPDSELNILTEWINKGAPFDPALEIKGDPSEGHRGFTVTDENRQWWAYKSVSTAAPPEPTNAEWANNGIDQFVLHGLEEAGLQPNPDAEPGVIIRRLYYDVIGLPPTPEAVTNYIKQHEVDPGQAYSDLIEELLASPHYGEKWARHWLDLVRYAESNGFERDNPKPEIWKYRDYVISAFNRDIPYDQFVIEQLAGDEIAEPTRDSLAATGYHRLMQWDDEPADRKQHVYDLLADNVQVTTETFLGSTLGCARCHDHKADPFSQKDYYSFMSFFHGVTHYQTPGTIYHYANDEQRKAFEKTRQDNIAKLKTEVEELETKIRDYLVEQELIKRSGSIRDMIYLRDGRKENPAKWEFTTKKPTDDWIEVGFRDKMWDRGIGGFGTRGTPNTIVKTVWNSKDIWMRASFGLKEIPEALNLELYHDEDVEVYLNGVEILRRKSYITNYQVFPLDKKALAALQTGRNVIAIHCKQTVGGQYVDAGLRTPVADSRKLEDIVRVNGNKTLITQIKDHFKADLYQQFVDKKKAITNWQQRVAGEPMNIVKERGDTPGPMYVHLRGSAHVMGDPVFPAHPAVFASSGNDPVNLVSKKVEWHGGKSSGRRLALANWMVSKDNPLTARVMVNRIWQHHFGRGIVPSSSDFGKLGEKPTHPELLDWLANEFMKSGWGIKDMHRLILQSRTYQMSSAPNSANSAVDPTNRLFWRNNMRRLTAEELRDSILVMSGKLEKQVGGHWVYPPLPEAVLATASRPGKGWPISKHEPDHYRRSVYIHVKRSLRPPMMTDFDQADTDSACAVRFATTVPNQALMMLNSKFVNDHAKLLGKRMKAVAGEPRAKISHGLELVTQKQAKAADIDICMDLYNKLQTQTGLSSDEAMNRVALLALNLNEFIYLD